MSESFAVRLLDLLPSVYREHDTEGDLAAFLGVPGATLDEIQEHIDRMPRAWDVDNCEPRYLPLLAALVGVELNPRQDTASQRRAIREAVESYRKKATLPAIRRALERLGWNGQIEETSRATVRLNRHASLNRHRLPGELYSLGVYRFVSAASVPGLRSALAPHEPAGTRRFFTFISGSSCQAGPRMAVNRLFATQWPMPEGSP
jgi:phage tail-like protein